MIFLAGSKGGPGASLGLLPGLFAALLFPFTVAAAPMGPPVGIPASEAVVLQLDGSALDPRVLSALSPEDLAQQVRLLIERSRESGSPRPLGLAQGLIARLPQEQWTPEVYLMRATVLQRLHRFDQAEADLDRVLKQQPGNRQAWLTRYSIALVRADAQSARQACQHLEQLRADLVAYSCTQELASYGELPQQAAADLRQRLETASNASAMERDYGLVTLAGIASRLNLPEAGHYWLRSLLARPEDLYRRARYADWLLDQGLPDEVIRVTQNYEHIDTLAVLRAIAMKRLGHTEAANLSRVLEQRFAEARWRGEFFHQWEYARFLLDVKERPELALEAARDNWRIQRSDVDRQLLIRAASAAGEPPGLSPAPDRGNL